MRSTLYVVMFLVTTTLNKGCDQSTPDPAQSPSVGALQHPLAVVIANVELMSPQQVLNSGMKLGQANVQSPRHCGYRCGDCSCRTLVGTLILGITGGLFSYAVYATK